MKTFLGFLFAAFWTQASGQTIDSSTVKQVDSLILVSRELTGKKDFEKAQIFSDRAAALAFSKLGPTSPTYASCLFNHGRILQISGKPELAVPQYLSAKKIQESSPGADPQNLASTLNNLGIILKSQEKYLDAERIYLQTKEIRARIFTKTHPQYAAILNNLGTLYYLMSRFEEAEKILLEAKELWEHKLEMDTVQYADVLDNLGDVYSRLGKFEHAESHFLAAKKLKGQYFGEDSHNYAQILNDLGNLYGDLMRYEEAERLFSQAIKIQAEELGADSYDYAWSATNLGNLYIDLGRFEESEKTLLEAKSIWEKIESKESPEYAACLDNLAVLYEKLGMLEKAEPVYKEGLEIRKVSLEEGQYLGFNLSNLGTLYEKQGRYKEALPLLNESKLVFEKTVGTENSNYAWALNNLGILFDKMGKYAAADSSLTAAKLLREKILGKNHPDYANNLEDLAILYQKMKRPEEALKLHLDARDIFEKTYGKQHPRYEECIRNLAVLHQKQGHPDLAAPLLIEANALQQSFLKKSTRHLSEREQAAYAANFISEIENLCSFARQNPAAAPNLPETLFDNAVFYKGFLLTAANRVRRLAEKDSVSSKNQELLAACNRRLAIEFTKPASERKGVTELESEANNLEKNLVKSVAGYAEAIQQVSWKDELAQLKPGEAVIEFMHYRFSNPEPTDSVFYGALVLRAGDAGPSFVQLFEKKSLDSLFGGHATRAGDYANSLYYFPKRGAKLVGKPQKNLFEMIWKPLEPKLAEVKTVYFSPSGLLHRLNLGAIPVSMLETISDKYQLVQLGSSRQLIQPSEINFKNQEAWLLGDIRYDLDSTAFSPAELMASRGENLGNPVLARTEDEETVSAWQPLDWTGTEVETIEGFYKEAGGANTAIFGKSATEESFKKLGGKTGSPRHIHLATHGYFFPDPPKFIKSDRAVFRFSQNPMIRSGLVLANGNFTWLNGRAPRPEMEDGILTAFEISQMNLSNTELVVLSACETGLGDIRGKEGVYGLQRAFKIAGVKYLVMSLWQVPDQETSVFMIAFYKKMLTEKMAIPDAFRAAQKEMKARFINPYQWAGFILVE